MVSMTNLHVQRETYQAELVLEIGVLQWIVELGRIDIDCEVSMMSSHMALPREEHLKELYHIFAYLKAHENAEMVFDPTPIMPDKSLFEREDWSYSPYGYD